MKLSNIFPQIKTDKVQVKKTHGVEETASSAKPAATDRVELSTSSADIQKMKEILQETPNVRMEKVQALKEQIERGEYQVDPHRVADKMLMSLMQEDISIPD